MLSLHQFRLMTNNGFGILLILVERIKIDIAQTWEGLHRTTGRIETMNKFLITSDSSFFPELDIISHSRFERRHLYFPELQVISIISFQSFI